MDFFEPLETFISSIFANDSDTRHGCEMAAKNVQLRFVTITVLFRKYQKMFDEFFIRDKSTGGGSSGRTAMTSSARKRLPPGLDLSRFYQFGWLLFLVARGKLLPQGQPDFLKLVYLLLCCLDLMLVHAPEIVRRIRIADLTAPTASFQATVSSSSRQDTLWRLCTNKDVHYPTVKEFQERVFLPFITTNMQLGVLTAEPDHPSASGHHSQSTSRDPNREHISPSTMYLPGLLDSCLDQNYRNLDREYGGQLFHSCDFDERLFLSNHPQLQTPHKNGAASSSSGDAAGLLLSPSKILGSPSHAASPNGSPPSSPIKATLTAASWLRKIVHPEGVTESPLQRLNVLLESYTGGAEELAEHAKTLLESCHFGGEDTNATRRGEALCLYLRLLESVVSAEERRIGKSASSKPGLVALLANSKFHKSLLVVASEIVMCCYNFPNAATPREFPHTLTVFGVSAYDFGKVVESVVRNELAMPRTVVKHLVRLEERVLEQLAWGSGSPLYDALDKTDERESLLQRLQETGTPQQLSGSACQVFSTPVKQRPGSSRPDSSAPPSPAPQQGATTKTTSLELFLRKVAHLISLRVRKMCDDLQISLPYTIPERMVQQIEYAMVYITTQTDLMLNRHLDVLIMCTVYSLAKVSVPMLAQQQPVTFKIIIEKYHLQPQARVPIYKYVRVAENVDEDVIKFYNKIFLPELETFLLGFQPPAPSSGPNSPAHATRQSGVKRATRFQEQQQKQMQQTQQQRRSIALQQISSPISFEKPRGRAQPNGAASSSSGPESTLKSPLKAGNFYFSPIRAASATPLGLYRGADGGGAGASGGRLVFQFGMSPHRQLEDINKSVNRDISAKRKLSFDVDLSDAPSSPSSSQEPAPDRRRSAKRKLDLSDSDSAPPAPASKRTRQSD